MTKKYRKKDLESPEPADITPYISKPGQRRFGAQKVQDNANTGSEFDAQEGVPTGASNLAYKIMGTIGWLNSAYTIAVIAIVLLADLTTVSVQDVLILVSVQNFTTVVFLAMHTKLTVLHPYDHAPKKKRSLHLNEAAIADEQKRAEVKAKKDFIRHTRNDRRSVIMVTAAILTIAANIIAAYVVAIADDVNMHALSFRETGNNTYIARTLDLLNIFILMTGVPVLLQFAAEAVFTVQTFLLPRFPPLDGETARLTTSEDSDSLGIATEH